MLNYQDSRALNGEDLKERIHRIIGQWKGDKYIWSCLKGATAKTNIVLSKYDYDYDYSGEMLDIISSVKEEGMLNIKTQNHVCIDWGKNLFWDEFFSRAKFLELTSQDVKRMECDQ